MDPITALQTASAVIQVVDFSVKIVGSTYEIYKAADGATQANIHVKGIASHLQSLCDRMSTASFANDANSQGVNGYSQLLELTAKGHDVARDILHLLSTLQIDRSQQFPTWQAFRKAIRGLRKASELDALKQRMDSLRSEMTLHLVYMMNNSQSSLAKSMHNLQQQCQNMNVEQVNLIKDLHKQLTPVPSKDQLAIAWQFHNMITRLESDSSVAEINRETWDRLCELAVNLRRYPTTARDQVTSDPSKENFEQLGNQLLASLQQHSDEGTLRAGNFLFLLTTGAPEAFRDWQPDLIPLYHEFARTMSQLPPDSRALIAEETHETLELLAGKIKKFAVSIQRHDANQLAISLDALAETMYHCLARQSRVGDYYAIIMSAARVPFRSVLLEVADRADQAVLNSQATSTALNVLDTLYFEELPMRHQDIPKSYRTTYSWVYDETASPFAKWLGSGDGSFWINGKAGSGKSTMMKFLSTDPRTKAALRRWSKGARLCILRFYFWNSGYPMQKTQHGLLQSLLFQVFSKCPEAIKSAAPRRWYTPRGAPKKPWTRDELEKTLLAALCHQQPPTRFCFFIDGLDEFEGDEHLLDHYELNSYLIGLTQSANIKLCISSRPWHVFEDFFGTSKERTFRLQDLNQQDLDLYVRGMLEEDIRFKRLATVDHNAILLAEEIRDTADGVFLWVFLVVKSLLRGLSERDDLQILQRRLRLLPKNLNDFFKHMLDNIDEVYLEHTTRSFLIAITAGEPLPVMAYRCMEVEIDNPNYALSEESHLQRRLFGQDGVQAQDDYRDDDQSALPAASSSAFLNAVKRKHREHVRERQTSASNPSVTRISACVNTWCRDLLEVRDNWFDNRTKNVFMQYKVDFLHRTAKDFLMSEPIRAHLIKTVTANYSPHLTLCRAWLALFKAHGRQRGPDPAEWYGFRDKAAHFARQCQLHGQPAPRAELQQVQLPSIGVSSSVREPPKSRAGADDDLRKYKSSTDDSQIDQRLLNPNLGFLMESVSDSNLHGQAEKHRKRDRFLTAFSRKEHSRTVSATQA